MYRFNVYIHYVNDLPIYVGSGSGLRYKSKQGRSTEHKKLMNDNSFKVILVHSNITKNTALDLEQQTYNNLINSGYSLLNKITKIAKTTEIDIKILSQVLEYDPSSPSCLVWKVDRKSGNGKVQTRAGQIAGYANSSGYYRTKYNNIYYKNHRLIWCLHYGDIPENFVIDHINRDKSDNRIENLRCVSQAENSRNRSYKKSNTGYQSISHSATTNTYSVVWTEDFNRKYKYFTHSVKSGITKENAFQMALDFRNKLVSLNKIILTSKDET